MKPAKVKPLTKEQTRLVVGISTDGLGKRHVRGMTIEEARRQMRRRNGGLKVQETGTGHRWTPESARAAILKRWAGRQRKRPEFGGRRLGVKTRYALRVSRPLLRSFYASHRAKGIWYDPEGRRWFKLGLDGQAHRIRERTALIKLGHLPSAAGFVPESIIEVQRWHEKCKRGRPGGAG